MKFSCTVEEVNMLIEVNKINFSSTSQHFLLTQKDKKEMDNGQICFYEIWIHSEYEGDKMSHYSPGHALTVDKDDLLEEVQHVLNEGGLVDKVLEHWDLSLEEGPRWKVKV